MGVPPNNPAPNKVQINWTRAVFVDRDINEDLVSQLTPQILKLKQESSEPITVGIDSNGGSVQAMMSLADLLDSPTPSGATAPFITVATNKAYSAAASLLALGGYSYALPGARILYHDIRFEALPNITSTRAREAARILQRDNDALALRLAGHVLPRMIWAYIKLSPHFSKEKERFRYSFNRLTTASANVMSDGLGSDFDFAGFVITLYAKTSKKADGTVNDAIDKVVAWTELKTLEAGHPSTPNKKGTSIDVLAGARKLYESLLKIESKSRGTRTNRSAIAKKFAERGPLEADTKLFLELIIREASTDPEWNINEDTLFELQRDFTFYREMENRFHKTRSSDLNAVFGDIICGRLVSAALEKANTEEKTELRRKLQPQMTLLWSFIVLLCRLLLEGEHDITPVDAQLLGLTNDVLGGGAFEGQRVF